MTAPPDSGPILIRGATLIDGDGGPRVRGDLLMDGDRLVAVGDVEAVTGAEVVDASGLIVAPGFIDPLSHSITPIHRDPRCLSKVLQGVTTEIVGEVWTPAPVAGHVPEAFDEDRRGDLGPAADEWVERSRSWTTVARWGDDLQAAGMGVNMGAYLGGGTLREIVIGTDDRPATAAEVAEMRTVMDAAMADGAFGVGTGLIYPPSAFATTDELVAVAEVIARNGGTYATHIRSEASQLLDAIDEAIEIGRASGAQVEIFHLKASGRPNWDKKPEVIARIQAARDAGVAVGCDVYPYAASGTGLAACLPAWASSLPVDDLLDPEVRARIDVELDDPDSTWENMGEMAGPENILLTQLSHPDLARFSGERLSAVAAALEMSWFDAIIHLLTIERRRIRTIYFTMREENMRLALSQPWAAVCSDAGGMDPEWAAAEGLCHPRAYGAFARVLGRYSRDEGLFPLEEAVRKMTSLPADRLGITDRGRLVPGAFADVVVFDAETVTDHATYTDPHQLATGVRDVWVNGGAVVRNGAHTGALPGRWLRHVQ